MAIWDQIKGATGGVLGDTSGASIASSVTILVFIVIIEVFLGGILFFILQNKAFNKKIVIFENISGQGYVPTGRDRSRITKIGDGGEEIMKLKKRKLYRTAYGKKIGLNTYAFAVGQDGYWYNITFGDLDVELKKLGVNPVDRDMRYMHVAIRRNIKERYEQVTFMQKYGGLIAYTALIAITGIMMWLLFDKFLSITGGVNSAIETAGKVMEKADAVLGKIDNVASGGSGFN